MIARHTALLRGLCCLAVSMCSPKAALTPEACVQADPALLVEDLGHPDRQSRACALLEVMGLSAVPNLVEFLRRARADKGTSTRQTEMALYMVGRLAGAAVSALPEVRAIYEFSRDNDVRRQAMWAIGQLTAASRDERVFEESMRHLRYHATP